MFSVVIPLYNKEKQIKQTLESVLNQTFGDFEIVIVNDGSKDGSVQVVQSINDPRIRLINQENGGVSAARNRGIKESNNEWIAFLDADDLWEENKLEEVNKIIQNMVETNYWICSGYQSLKGEKKHSFVYPNCGLINDALYTLVDGLRIQTSTVVARKKYFMEDERLFFAVGINASEDREVWYRLAFRFPLYYINKSLSYYVIDQTGNSLNTLSNKSLSFLSLGTRLSNDIIDLPEDRKMVFWKFYKKNTRENIWLFWIRYGWKEDYDIHLGSRDSFIMKLSDSLPHKIKRILFKIIV